MYRYNTYKVFIAILWQFLCSWLNILGLLIRAKSFPFAVLWCLGVQWLSSLWFYYVMNFCSSSTLWHVISRGFCFLLWRFLCMVCIHVHILDFVLFFFNDLTWILVRFLDRFVDIYCLVYGTVFYFRHGRRTDFLQYFKVVVRGSLT